MRPFTHTIPFADAVRLVLAAAVPIERVEPVTLADASGRVVARDVTAAVDVPPFDRAAMDGYAVVAADTAGAHTAARFFLGLWMGIGAMVFLGCPFRMLQRIGGGDLNAVVGLAGFLAGVGLGRLFEQRGYTSGKTAVVITPAGVPALLLALGGLALFLAGSMPHGPGPGDMGSPPHAPWFWALGIALVAGALPSWTGFCAISAFPQPA